MLARPLALLTAATLLTAGCPTWEDVDFYDQVAWADDDSVVAVVELRYEAKPSANPLNGTPNKRNWRHQLFLQQVNGSQKVAIGGERDGQNSSHIYYMKAAGYLVVGSLPYDTLRFDRVALDGSSQLIAQFAFEDCRHDYFDVVPSPTGNLLALIHRDDACLELPAANPITPPDPLGPQQGLNTIRVTFLDAQTLEVVAEPETVQLSSWGLEWTWRPQGDFVVVDQQSALSLSPGLAPVVTDRPDCMWPKTTSSAWSGAGVFIYGEDHSVKMGGTNPAAAFGCQ